MMSGCGRTPSRPRAWVPLALALAALAPGTGRAEPCDQYDELQLAQAGQDVVLTVTRGALANGADYLVVNGSVTRTIPGEDDLSLDYRIEATQCRGEAPDPCRCLVGSAALVDECVRPGDVDYLLDEVQERPVTIHVSDTAHPCLRPDGGPDGGADDQPLLTGCRATGAPGAGGLGAVLVTLAVALARRLRAP